MKSVYSDAVQTPEEPKSLAKTQSVHEIEENCDMWTRNFLSKARITKITAEYRDIKDWKPDKFSVKTCEKNADKNRYKSTLCADQNRVVLKDRDASNDYIHASWMDMPDSVRFISTQGPIKSTIADFWHMIFTEKCQVIVMLCNYVEDTEKCAKYFSADSEVTHGEYRIKVVDKQSEPWSPVRWTVLRVKNKKDVKLTVHHFWYYDWHDQIAPLDPSPMIKLYKMALQTANGSPIVVHCSAGVGRTATFVGIHLGAEMIKVDPTVDFQNVMKSLRQMRLGAIQSQLQYIFLQKYSGITAKVHSKIVEEEKKKSKLSKVSKETKETKEVKEVKEVKEPKNQSDRKKTVSRDSSAVEKHDVLSTYAACDSNRKEKKLPSAGTPKLSRTPSLARIIINKLDNKKRSKKAPSPGAASQ
ncbi:unnamed protein product [Caenorhabditis angaria]|uniref:Protein-tyrosine-phosphatase n=1 Tax=Caenorhabditis angaria TaxID=860376 RepID=A0A9P1IJE9_9PELO|nr:unnamed protein product [Caenorhabditis angaria]